jgi:dihydropteroate synthase
MGILNVTPDSFSDGGSFTDPGAAVDHALRLAAQGADIIDIGGESTRPGATPVSLDEEMRRVIPVLRALRLQTTALLSVDTMKAAVAAAALDCGADIINDVSGFTSDPAMIHLAAHSQAGLVVMHMRGNPRTMQSGPDYSDVAATVAAFFRERLETLEAAGVDPRRVALDPGFGFGKTLEHNLDLARRLQDLRVGDRPILAGVSRKSMLEKISGAIAIADRDWATVALTAWLRESGATIHRVHSVVPAVQALRMTEAIAA